MLHRCLAEPLRPGYQLQVIDRAPAESLQGRLPREDHQARGRRHAAVFVYHSCPRSQLRQRDHPGIARPSPQVDNAERNAWSRPKWKGPQAFTGGAGLRPAAPYDGSCAGEQMCSPRIVTQQPEAFDGRH
jgi:hypothetical protein